MPKPPSLLPVEDINPMGRYMFKYGWRRNRPRDMVRVTPVIAIYDKKYVTAMQAAITIAWIVTSNLSIRMGQGVKGWSPTKEMSVYKKALRRIKPICERLLDHVCQWEKIDSFDYWVGCRTVHYSLLPGFDLPEFCEYCGKPVVEAGA